MKLLSLLVICFICVGASAEDKCTQASPTYISCVDTISGAFKPRELMNDVPLNYRTSDYIRKYCDTDPSVEKINCITGRLVTTKEQYFWPLFALKGAINDCGIEFLP